MDASPSRPEYLTAERASKGKGVSPRIEGFLIAASGLLAAVLLLTFGWLVYRRIRYPFELDWMEGATVDHVARLLEGKGIYVRPSIDFVPFMYNPLYYFVSAGLSHWIPLGFLPLRVVSVTATLATFWFVFEIVRREVGAPFPALLATGVYAGTYPLSGAYWDECRIDAFALSLCLATVLVAQRAGTRPRRIAAGLVFALAFAARQNALPLLPALWFHFARRDGLRESLWFVVPGALSVVLGVLVLNHATSGWYWYYAYTLPTSHRILPSAVVRIEMWSLGIATVLTVPYFVRREARRSPTLGFYFLSLSALVVMGLIGILHSGGFYNQYLPIYAALACGLGICVGGTMRSLPRGSRRTTVASAVGLVTLAGLVYDPRPYVPTSQDLQNVERLLQEISLRRGDVLLPEHGFITRLAGKRTFAHEMAVIDVLRGPPKSKPVADALAGEFVAAVQHHRFGAIITEPDWPWTFQSALFGHYGLVRRFPYRATHYFYHRGPREVGMILFAPLR